MEFWGVEVKPGETLKINPGEAKYLHLSQASLGEVKKDKAVDNVPIYVKFDNQKLVLGTLSSDKYPQIQYDLVFEKEFELSHKSKTTSIFFCGYKTVVAEDDGFDQFSDESGPESDEDVPAAVTTNKKENGKPVVKNEQPKVTNTLKENASAAKSKPKLEDAAKAGKQKVEEEDDDEDDESEEDESDDDEEMGEGEDDSDDEDEDEDDSSDEEDETTPKKAQAGNKRPLGSASKTPIQDKKAKLISPLGQKAGGSNKKVGHTATPHPAKQVGKMPGNDKSKQQTPKSSGSVTCKSCNKSFNSDSALQAHTKAKHEAK